MRSFVSDTKFVMPDLYETKIKLLDTKCVIFNTLLVPAKQHTYFDSVLNLQIYWENLVVNGMKKTISLI